MKNTITIVVFIATWFLAWLFIAFIPYIASDMSYKECLSHVGVGYATFFLGWIPAMGVAMDINEL
jgi:hypothetical protein